MKLPVMLAVTLVMPGCTAVGAATKLATMPVRAASRAIDVATVSQSERDEQRGRELRERDERLGELNREYRRQSFGCERGEADACARRDAAWREIQALAHAKPYPDE